MKKLSNLLWAISAVLISTIAANAQMYAGLKGGISIPNLTAGGGNPVSSGWSSRLGPYFGAVGEYQLSTLFSIQAELNYSSQGGKKDGKQAIATSDFFNGQAPPGTPKYVYANYTSVVRLNYIELPVMLHFNFDLGNTMVFFIGGGPYAGYLLNAKNINSGSSPVYEDKDETVQLAPTQSFDSTQDITADIKRFNFGIQGGLGLAFKLGDNKLVLTGGGNYGFVNIQKNTDNGQNKTGAATVTLSYLFQL